MEELESQIAKIALGNNKSSTSYIYLMAEKAPAGGQELYVVAELPLLNPAASEPCEKICLAIGSALKRSYKRSGGDSAFENAIAAINEELGKLAEMGQTHWVDKLNCVLAVKNNHGFTIATCGKVSAFLLRNGEYTDISCSQEQSHPLKTFENYASGKIRLGDLLILSTIQLFNHISMDRLLRIFGNADFLTSTQTIIQLLKETADPQTSFGILLNLQVPLGETPEQEVDLENYVVETQSSDGIVSKVFSYAKTAFVMDKGPKRGHATDLPTTMSDIQGKPAMNVRPSSPLSKLLSFLPNKGFLQNFSRLSHHAKNLKETGKGLWQLTKISAKSVKENFKTENLKGLSKQKKVLLISAAILLVAVIANIGIAWRMSGTKANKTQITTSLQEAQGLLLNSQSSLLYKNDLEAGAYFEQAKTKIPAEKDIDSSNKELYAKVMEQYNALSGQMEKKIDVEATNLGSLGASDALIVLPQYLATESNKTIVSYNRESARVEDNTLKTSVGIASSVDTGSFAVIYNEGSLYTWDYSKGEVGGAFSQSVPQAGDFAGMAYYPTNRKVYLVDRKSAAIVSFLPVSGTFSQPTVSVNEPSLSEALDIAIDGSVYILNKNGITEFLSGKLTDFTMPKTPVPFSGRGKIYTQKDFAYLYVLDSGNNRVLIIDKRGGLVATLVSPEFSDLKDFEVDEKGKVMHVLNGSSLLRVKLP